MSVLGIVVSLIAVHSILSTEMAEESITTSDDCVEVDFKVPRKKMIEAIQQDSLCQLLLS